MPEKLFNDAAPVPPQNIQAEASLLSAIFHNDDVFLRVQEIVKPEDFYVEAHKKIYEAMFALFNRSEPTDLVTVGNYLDEQKHLESVGGAAALARIVDEVPLAVNPAAYARIIREKALLRKLIARAHAIIEKCHGDGSDAREIVDFAEHQIFSVSGEKADSSMASLQDLLVPSLKKIEERKENKSNVTGVPTGYTMLNKMTAGLQPSDLIILAARPGMGKTALALNIARNAALSEEQVPILVFSLEMSKEQLVTRMLCSQARVNSERVRSGFVNNEEITRIYDAAERLDEAPIFIDDSPFLSALDVRTKARRIKKDKGLGLVVIDYLQLMKGPPGVERRELEISEISRSLKALAKEIQVPVLALSQLNRKVEERADKRPQLSDLRESGALEQDADMIMFIYREAAYSQEEEPGDMTAEIKIAKQRNGPTGKFSLFFHSEFTSFEEPDTIYSGAAAANG